MTITLDGTLGVTTPAETITGTLAVTGITTVAAGSAALPSIVSTTGTADTGMWFPAADTIAYSTAGTERMRIDSSGLVGINNNSPSSLNAAAYNLVVGDGAASNKGISIFCGPAYYGSIHFADGTSGADAYRGIITYYHNDNSMSFYTNATEKMRIDTSGNVLVTNPAGLGYGTGSGGTVTQATSKSTAVTLNKPTGQITLNNSALGANSVAQFSCSNSLCADKDTVVTSLTSVGGVPSLNNYQINSYATSGIIYFGIRNTSAGSLSEAVVFNFAIIKGATA